MADIVKYSEIISKVAYELKKSFNVRRIVMKYWRILLSHASLSSL